MIKFHTVTKQFANGTVALQNLSFEIETGEMALITGPSGSGKTTIMKLLIKDYQPTAGEIWFGEQRIDQLKSSQVPAHRRQIGVIFQDYKLIDDLNVWENIALPLNIINESQANIEDRVTDLLKLVDLTDKALMFPIQLSGGEAQRVSIARALATGPKLIFADEPTGNLDAAASLHLVKLLEKINQLGTTLLLASHDQLVLDHLKKIKTIKLGCHLTQPTDSEDNSTPAPAKKTKSVASPDPSATSETEAEPKSTSAKAKKNTSKTSEPDSKPDSNPNPDSDSNLDTAGPDQSSPAENEPPAKKKIPVKTSIEDLDDASPATEATSTQAKPAKKAQTKFGLFINRLFPTKKPTAKTTQTKEKT